MSVRVRFAPSPSGDLHVGNARTALFNWLFARSRGGTYILRIEDSDADRSDEAAVAAIVASLAWLGLAADEGWGQGGPHEPYRQSLAADLYRAAAKPLLEAGRAYWCFDPPRGAGGIREDPGPKRPHPDLGFAPAEVERRRAAGGSPSLRFNAFGLEGAAAWDDLVRGRVEVDLDEIRDFTLMKGDGTPVYNWACVVDDHRMGVTDVLRGEDGISNTPRQLLLYRFLGWEPPRFGHLSFILGPDGAKLSKRHGDTGVGSLRKRGYLPEALLNYLALLGLGGEGEGSEVFTREELKARFDPARLVSKPAVFDLGKLDFLNAHWLRAVSPARLRELAEPFLDRETLEQAWSASGWGANGNETKDEDGLGNRGGDGRGDGGKVFEAWLDRALQVCKGNAGNLKELGKAVTELLSPASVLPEALPAALQEAQAFPRGLEPARALLKALGEEGTWQSFVTSNWPSSYENHGGGSMASATPPSGAASRPSAAVEGPFADQERVWKGLLKKAQESAGLRGRDYFFPLRLALTGTGHGPELPALLALLGPERVQKNLEAFLDAAKASGREG